MSGGRQADAGVSAAPAAGGDGPRELLIVGAGGFARETAQAVLALAAADRAAGRPERLRLLGHLDDDAALHGVDVDGTPVLGGCERVHDLPAAQVVVCVGSPRDHAVRARLVRRLGLPRERYATVVHPTASVARSCTVGPGSVLLAHCVLTAAVEVGAHVAVMPHTVLTHDDAVGDFATIASGVRLGGGVRVERGAYVGSGALVREYTVIGGWSLVGMGSVVLGDVPPGEVWAGTPARRLRAAGPAELAESAEPREQGADREFSGAAGRTAGRGSGGTGPGPATGMGTPGI
ncbi:NeuD/PglB/VioB family sugar acetyltransferase [Streptomyces sp. V4-01]|uniref:NeuD/PglB/VioB family sugar acetyltransferase n=1 Tax=Actinacidiphila polyblastidii TaxID=3110430 RepID=A0ABU7PG68_9ACTN|nr:NeuD/PglB/VioB family sugar acetyltransferase [Streptomyces sp. V4-01]